MDRASRLEELIDGAEELLTNLTDPHNPDIQALRDRVDQAIATTRRAIARSEDDLSVKLREIVHAVDDYVHDYPWVAIATGVLVAGTIAYVAGATARSEKRIISG